MVEFFLDAVASFFSPLANWQDEEDRWKCLAFFLVLAALLCLAGWWFYGRG
ncbi:MAG TPA: hypothetical protein VM490_19820 [Armatimonadaceae bacterium]|jgi:hypothetical protein|nr:hypothetical protein [Armatimonadaceae bacterium]